MSEKAKPSVWVFGDQLNVNIESLRGRSAEDCRVLFVESEHKILSKPWHTQRQHLIISAMSHFAAELVEAGYEVDYRRASSYEEGLRMHCEDFSVGEVVAMAPASWGGRKLLERLGVAMVPNNQFLCGEDDFAAWSQTRKNMRMEDFYRWQRKRLDVLMDGTQPEGGRWNFDAENRKPPPKDGRSWPALRRFPLDQTDHAVLHRLPNSCVAEPNGTCPVT